MLGQRFEIKDLGAPIWAFFFNFLNLEFNGHVQHYFELANYYYYYLEILGLFLLFLLLFL